MKPEIIFGFGVQFGVCGVQWHGLTRLKHDLPRICAAMPNADFNVLSQTVWAMALVGGGQTRLMYSCQC